MPLPTDLPTGARALLIALATPSPQGPIGIPVLLWGRPGVGKSSFIEGLERDDLRVTTLIASIHDPTDFSGLPVFEEGTVRYAVPEWVRSFGPDGDGILFLDELSTAPPSVQAALLRVVFERRVGFHRLPDGVRIVAAANPPDLMVGGWELSPPLRNRFVHLQWDIPAELYVRSLTQGWAAASLPRVDASDHGRCLPDWKLKIGGFLRISPNLLHGDPEENQYGFPSPRSWDFAAALLTTCDLLNIRPGGTDADQGILLDLMAGCLGEGAAVPLLDYLTRLRIPNPEAVLAGNAEVDVENLDDSELYVLFYGMNSRLLEVLKSEKLLSYSSAYLDLVDRVFTSGRRDVIFVPLKELARAGWVASIAAADDADRRGAALEQIGRLFSDATFKEFVDVLA